nr:PREDICTED: tachykinins [Bemisia tabaci]XP_018901298.1 PREDICTED: tachykinins [Bemisia tabaci]
MYSLLLLSLFTLLGLGPAPSCGAIEKRSSFDYELQDKKEGPLGGGGGGGSGELVHEGDVYDYAGLEKRAPMGFHGMRGKKKTNNGLMGFVGTRGKKFDYSDADFQLLDAGIAPYLVGEKRGPSQAFFGMRGKKVPSGSNFFGVRGKKAPSNANFFGVRGKKAPSGFIGMRGKKYSEDDRLEELIDALKDYTLDSSREKRDIDSALSFQDFAAVRT